MRSYYLFLLLYLLGSCLGSSNQQRDAICNMGEACDQAPDSTARFLQCVGLPATDPGRDHMRNLKGMLDATMDVYTFMKSSMTGVPLLSLMGELKLTPGANPLQNEALVQMWLDVKMKPLLKSITKHFLICLSTKNFSCSTYQTVVKELSHHFSEMDPVRQKWIYTFFMYPFLSGEGVAGCVKRDESSEEWLMKNFGAFKVMARMKDLSTLNVVFSGLEVLHLLSPAQKAELLLRPEVAGLNNGTLSLVFHSLLTGGNGPRPTMTPGGSHTWTSPGYHPTFPPNFTYFPYLPASPHNSLTEAVNGLMVAFRPMGSLVHNFVSFTKQRNVSEIRVTTLAQFLLNWTLAEMSQMYQPQNASAAPEMPTFDMTNAEEWYRQVVMPMLWQFLPNEQALMNENLVLAFHKVFYLDQGMDNQTNEIQDVCSITVDERPCGLTDAVENVAKVLHCAARTNLTMSETTIMRLIMELTRRLNSLVKELSTANFTVVASDFQQMFGEADSPSLMQENLEDPEFIKLWFKIKLMPLLPNIPPQLLSCLSTKNFSCPVFQTIVQALSKHMRFKDADPMYSHNIYKHFIYPFLRNHNTSVPRCVFPANRSAEWLMENFGFFSQFASIQDFYELNPNFSGLDALHVLSPKQTAELLLLPLRTPPEKDVVIDKVFDFLLESPEDRKFKEVVRSLVQLAHKVYVPCDVYRHIFERLYRAITSVPLHMESFIWAHINELINIAPEACVPEHITCPVIQLNSTNICRGVDSSHLQSYLVTSMDVPCNLTLETYACAKLENFTAYQLASLLKCHLPGNSSQSRALWKMLLTKLTYILDPALDILADMPMSMVGPSATAVLDVIGEIRLSMLTADQLRNTSVIRKWFSFRLRGFLPFASGMFLRCLSGRNLSCHSYQQILQVLSHRFDNMTESQQDVVLRDFIFRFLSNPQSGPGCVLASNRSAEWLKENLGPFSVFLSVKEMLHLNPEFSPLEVLPLLSPKQRAELLVLTVPGLPKKDVIINALFDFLGKSPEKLPRFLSYLVMFLQPGDLSCSSYKTLFDRLDMAITTVSADIASSITHNKMALFKHIPPGCIIYTGECNVISTNETDICAGVNSTMVQLHLDSGKLDGRLCDFGVQEFACASLEALTAGDLVAIFKCHRFSNSSGSRPVWRLLLSKASHVLDEALDLLSNMTLDGQNPAVSMILDAIREVRLDGLNLAVLNDPAFIQLWFNHRLRPFLPAISTDFLSCLAMRGLTCSTYQHIVQTLSLLQPHMTPSTMMSVYTHFIKVFLTRRNVTDPNCSSHINTREWLQRNLGAFSALASFRDLMMLNSNFSAMEVLPELTVRQLAEVASTPGQLTSPDQVTMVTKHVPDRLLPGFFDEFAAAIMGHESMLPSPVRSALLQVVFDRANLSDHSVGDAVVSQWLLHRLRPLLINLSPAHVAPFFKILAGRNCTIGQQGVEDLNMTIASLSEQVQKEIHNHIVQSLKGPMPLRCYGDNFNQSFYIFLEGAFLGFQFPRLTSFLSLMPENIMHQLVNSMPPSNLGDFLRRPDVVDNDELLCVLYGNYVKTPVFLETEDLPAAVRRPTLPCVWPVALSSSSRSEVNAWFNRRLPNYLVFLTKSLISPSYTQNASCLAFQDFVVVLGRFNYMAADFAMSDVFDSIRSYLTAASAPRCYEPNNPALNSTAWFAEYIGPFIGFLTLDDLLMFGSAQIIQVFTVNTLNIALFNHTSLPVNLTNYYTELVYQQDSNFNPLFLPLSFRCVAPGPAFAQLSANDSIIILHNLTTMCTELDPQITSALAGNFGDQIDATTISTLGNESSGISTGQISMINPSALLESLNVLSSVMGWNEGQARAIIHALMSSGAFQISDASALFNLGTLIKGVPSATFSSIGGAELLTASKNPSFIVNIISAPQIVQQVFVTQIISVNSNSDTIAENVPDELATEIPRPLLLGFTSSEVVLTRLNKKRWKQKQVELFFNVIAVESATTVLGSPNDLSSSVLQGFTCTGVRTFRRVQIKRLIRACRRTGTRRVKLVETQLTCMYNYIRGDSDATSFDLYPPDMLLYYDYSLVPQANCRSYFQQLADADFFVFSSDLDYKRALLFDNARSCLDITTTTLTEDNVSVLGNMCCVLDGSYIQNSDPSILEMLKSCSALTAAQANAAENLLKSGRTQYGDPATWNQETLRGLGMLPLYMTSSFYDYFNKRTKRRFLRYFLRVLRRNGVSRRMRRRLRREIRKSIRNKTKRSIVSECTVGEITQVTISDEAFPFDYDDVGQFNCCLSASTVKDNLDPITDKVDDEEYLRIVLDKLHEAYASSSNIPEAQVQLLGAASRVATTDDISMWVITEIDTLSALMDSSDGEWEGNLADAIITKYLSQEGKVLGKEELNAIGGVNLCFLDVNILKNISVNGLKEADVLTVSSCTLEKKKQLFVIALAAFGTSTRSTIPLSEYQLISPYVGGASQEYIQNLAGSNISMDLATFTGLDESVVLNLTVDEVRNLLGTNLPDLKSYENQTLVRSWIQSRLQTDLDTLGLDLEGGRASPSTSPTTNKTPVTSSSSAAGAATTPAASSPSSSSGSATTTGKGARIHADVLVLLALLLVPQHLLI